jgi:hypothetical protein
MQSSTVDFIYDYYSIEGSESNTLSNTNASSVNTPTTPKPEFKVDIKNVPTQNGMVSRIAIDNGYFSKDTYNINGNPFRTKTIVPPVEPFKYVPK